MCLDHSAHGVVSDHEIFQRPLSVDLKFDQTKTPEHYRQFFHGRELGDTMQTWRVQQSGYQQDESMPAGVVSSGWGFDDSPDAEVIAGGINSKGPNAVAIGRHGPFFHWGFSAEPSRMTEAGCRAFVNAICYISRFDGQPLLSRSTTTGRGYVLDGAQRTLRLQQGFEQALAAYERSVAQRAALEKAKQERELTVREQRILSYQEPVKPTLASFKRSRLRAYPRELRDELGDEHLERYLTYYQENLGYLHRVGRDYVVDEDAKALGFANRDPAILDAAIRVLEQGAAVDESARAMRVLRRYTDRQFDLASEWRAWFELHRGQLFFTDVGGYRFYSSRPDPAAQRRLARANGRDLEVDEASPVAFDGQLLGQVAPGAVLDLAVRVRIAEHWHIYAEVGDNSPYPATRIELTLPAGCVALGDWGRPAAKAYAEGSETVYEGEVVFLRRVRLGETLAGGAAIDVEMSWQACDADHCLPPDRRTESVSLRARPAVDGEANKRVVHSEAAAQIHRLMQAYEDGFARYKRTPQKQRKNVRYPSRVGTVHKVLELVDQEPRGRAAVAGLSWAHRKLHYSDGKLADLRLEIATRLVRDYSDRDDLHGFCMELSRSKDPESVQQLRAIADASPHAMIRSQARYSLAARLRESDPGAAVGLLEQVLAEDVEVLQVERPEIDDRKSWTGTLAERAREELHELRHLSVGCTAPDIVGEDLAGKPMKLSQYRGRVVVLDFWGFW